MSMRVKHEKALVLFIICTVTSALILNYVEAKEISDSGEIYYEENGKNLKNYGGKSEIKNNLGESTGGSEENSGNYTSNDENSFLLIPINTISISIFVILVIIGAFFTCLMCVYLCWITSVIRRDNNRL